MPRLPLRTLLVLSIALAAAGPIGAADPTSGSPAAESQADEAGLRIAELIEQLGDMDYFVRERAQEELAKAGFEAFDALEAAEFSDDIEIAARAKYLLRRMRVDWAVEGDPAMVRELLTDYEQQSESIRLERIAQLARLPKDAGLTAVCRLVRFERSPLVSKQAALTLIEQPAAVHVDWAARAEIVGQNLRRSVRPAAEWLKTYVAAHQDAAAAVDGWAAHVLKEEEAQALTPEETQPEFVVALLRQQVAALEGLDRREESLAVMRKMLALESGASESLTTLIGWLVDHQAWTVLDELAQRFALQLESDPLLMYALADARQSQGEEELAAATAARAREINPADGETHREIASVLQRRGRFDWAEAEYRHVINQAPRQPDGQRAASSLAEMLHDQLRELEAAQTLEGLAKVMEENVEDGNDRPNVREPASVRSRMHYFFACHHEAAGERAQQIARLEQGLREDPLDADVLIGLHRLPDRTPAQRKRTLDYINAAAASFRKNVEDEGPEDIMAINPYNQLAWLVGNTEGDYYEALDCSKKSLALIDKWLEMIRSNDNGRDLERLERDLVETRPGFLDTLGRCYYAVGDYENAVRVQSQAVALEPHSGQMGRQLKLFQETLATKPSRPSDERAPSAENER